MVRMVLGVGVCLQLRGWPYLISSGLGSTPLEARYVAVTCEAPASQLPAAHGVTSPASRLPFAKTHQQKVQKHKSTSLLYVHMQPYAYAAKSAYTRLFHSHTAGLFLDSMI